MPEPYTAVGLIPTVWGIRNRAEIQKNLEHISHLIKAASWLASPTVRTSGCVPYSWDAPS